MHSCVIFGYRYAAIMSYIARNSVRIFAIVKIYLSITSYIHASLTLASHIHVCIYVAIDILYVSYEVNG